jgi:hypothetical protein
MRNKRMAQRRTSTAEWARSGEYLEKHLEAYPVHHQHQDEAIFNPPIWIRMLEDYGDLPF